MARQELGELYWKITGDDAKLNQSIKRSEGSLKNLGKIGGATVAALGAAFIAAGTAAFNLAKDAGEAADKLLDLEQITGLSTNTLQEFQFVAAEAGVDFDGLVGSVQRFTARLPQIESGSSEAARAFESLGVNLRDANGNIRDTDELFPELITSLQGIENVTERNAVAQQLFGRSLGDLAPVLGMSAEQMAALRQEANDVGAVLSRDALNSANRFRASLDTLEVQVEAAKTAVGAGFAPIFEAVLIPALEQASGWLTGIANDFVSFTQSGDGIAKIGDIFGSIAGAVSALGATASPVLDSLKMAATNILEPFQSLRGETESVGIGFSLLGGVSATLSGAINIIGTVIAGTITNLVNFGKTIKAVAELGGAAWERLTGQISREEFREAIDGVGSAWETFGTGLVTTSLDTFSAIGDAVTGFQSRSEEASAAATEAFTDSFLATKDVVVEALVTIREESAETTESAIEGQQELQEEIDKTGIVSIESFDAAKNSIDEYKQRAQLTKEAIVNLADAGVGALTSSFSELGEQLVAGEASFSSFGKIALNAIASVLDAMGALLAAQAAYAVAAALIPGLQAAAIGAGPALAGSAAAYLAAGVVRGLASTFNTGGIVPGAPSSSDTVPAILTPGEEVITQDDPRHMFNSGRGQTVFKIMLPWDDVAEYIVNDKINTGEYTIDARGLR